MRFNQRKEKNEKKTKEAAEREPAATWPKRSSSAREKKVWPAVEDCGCCPIISPSLGLAKYAWRMCPVNKKEERKSTGAYISVPTHTTTTTTTAPKRNNNKKRSIHLEISRCKLIAPYHRCAALDIYSLGATHFLFSRVCVCLFVCFSSFERDSASADYPQTTDDVEEEEEEEGKVLHLSCSISLFIADVQW